MTTEKRGSFLILCLLGSLSVISPFAIDLYLPAFSRMADELGTSSAVIALTLSSYFIGMALGQVVYGPLLDRFGRKRPLYAGLALFILTTLACAHASDIDSLVELRFVQALGGCVAGVASLAMVRDFFPVQDTARVLSRLFLFIGVSPLLAPTIGGMLTDLFGWRAVFLLLAMVVALILTVCALFLPEGHQSDKSISLRPDRILREYIHILVQPQFITYALAGAFAFAGLFTFVAGSPIIFMEQYQLGPKVYGAVFASLAFGFIGGNQLNVQLLKRYDSRTLFLRALLLETAIGALFLLGTMQDWLGLWGTLIGFFAFLSVVGIAYPNAAALALEPFTRNAGSASAMLGFVQLGVGALISTGIGAIGAKGALPIITILASTAAIALVIQLIGRNRRQLPLPEEQA